MRILFFCYTSKYFNCNYKAFFKKKNLYSSRHLKKHTGTVILKSCSRFRLSLTLKKNKIRTCCSCVLCKNFTCIRERKIDEQNVEVVIFTDLENLLFFFLVTFMMLPMNFYVAFLFVLIFEEVVFEKITMTNLLDDFHVLVV